MIGATYNFTTDASANLREKDDALNTTIGAFLAGSTLGLKGMMMSKNHQEQHEGGGAGNPQERIS